jgi:serine protease Do
MRAALYVSLLLFLFLSPPAAAQEEKIAPASRAEMQYSFAPVVRKVAPAVVNIYTKRREQVHLGIFADPFFNQFFGGMGGINRERVVSSLGSGVIIDARGVVVTSNHVVEGSEDVVAVLSDRREFRGKILVSDPSTDLALVKLETKETLPALPVVDSDRVEVGDLVLAVGNPFGVGQTVTSGIVSALARSAKGVSDYDFFIQTDAAINPGNSGGALVNMAGELIGINTAIYSKTGGSLGIGFAIPSSVIRALVRDARADGTVVRPWLGAAYQDITPEIAESLGLKSPSGALVAKVFPGSPAAQAGLAPGDVILGVNGSAVGDAGELKFRTLTAGDMGKATLDVLREGKRETRQVALAPPPEIPARDARTLKGAHPLQGITVANLSPRVAVELGMDAEHEAKGVVVYDAPQRGRFGFRRGDILLEINRTPVTSSRQVEGMMKNRSYGWRIRFSRGGRELALSVQR